MLFPQLAPVRPRISIPSEGISLLADEIAARLERGATGLIGVWGAPGSGRTTAISHLAEVFRQEPRLILVDGTPDHVLDRRNKYLVVCTAPVTQRPDEIWKLAPWTRDDCIEYLLAVHPHNCAGVIARLDERGFKLGGSPELWRVVLDQLAADGSLAGIRPALRRALAKATGGPDALEIARQGSLLVACHVAEPEQQQQAWIQDERMCAAARNLLRHQPVRLLAAADQLVSQLRNGLEWDSRYNAFPEPLVREVAALVADDKRAIHALYKIANGDIPQRQPMACSLLHAARLPWRPGTRRRTLLARAYLQGVCWPKLCGAGLRLQNANFSAAELSEADLEDAVADGANFTQANLSGAHLARLQAECATFAAANLSMVRAGSANLRRADLRDTRLEGAFLSQANLSQADLRGARLGRANLIGAQLPYAQIAGADFTGADLAKAQLNGLSLQDANFTGAVFDDAKMRECNLEGMHLPGASFLGTDLRGALLTGSRIPAGKFRDADLRGAGLADVEWENADLRDTDLRNCTFHLGSSRSGLVGSPIACEGSRTGFYTDELEEWMFKAPEEVRKANLCGADLRGADLEHTDFYLVDLRGARYSSEQEQHLRRTGAILKARV